MELHEKLFLEALNASLKNKKVCWDFDIPKDVWQKMFDLGDAHKVLPLLFEAVHFCPAIKSVGKEFYDKIKQRCVTIMVLQIRKSAEFLALYRHLLEQQVKPVVVKGILCRQLYPNPDLRISSDEDVLVREADFEKTAELLLAYGMQMTKDVTAPEEADEIGFLSANGVSYIELHKFLFSNTSEAYGELNDFFTDIFDTCVPVKVDGTVVYGPEPGQHLFYLICHAFKHFLHSGFGIRQVCDIVLFANAYGECIDWQKMLAQCRAIRAEKFTAAIFGIGKKYLVFDEAKACYPKEWQEIEVDEEALLMELLGSGIYGSTTMSRRHSSNMTLEAVAAGKRGEKSANPVMKTLFPPVKSLENKYQYLQKRPYLLPVAWSERILNYHKELKSMDDNSAVDTVKIGNQRIELLKQYGIIE